MVRVTDGMLAAFGYASDVSSRRSRKVVSVSRSGITCACVVVRLMTKKASQIATLPDPWKRGAVSFRALSRIAASASKRTIRSTVRNRSNVREIKIGRTCWEACTGPFQPKVTVRQFQSGTPGPV